MAVQVERYANRGVANVCR